MKHLLYTNITHCMMENPSISPIAHKPNLEILKNQDILSTVITVGILAGVGFIAFKLYNNYGNGSWLDISSYFIPKPPTGGSDANISRLNPNSEIPRTPSLSEFQQTQTQDSLTHTQGEVVRIQVQEISQRYNNLYTGHGMHWMRDPEHPRWRQFVTRESEDITNIPPRVVEQQEVRQPIVEETPEVIRNNSEVDISVLEQEFDSLQPETLIEVPTTVEIPTLNVVQNTEQISNLTALNLGDTSYIDLTNEQITEKFIQLYDYYLSNILPEIGLDQHIAQNVSHLCGLIHDRGFDIASQTKLYEYYIDSLYNAYFDGILDDNMVEVVKTILELSGQI